MLICTPRTNQTCQTQNSGAHSNDNLMKKIVLASTSPYRLALLQKLGLPFVTAKPDVDETAWARETPQHLVQRLAKAKAAAVSQAHPEAWIIGSDQVACLEGEPLGKPGTLERAEQQLQQLSGRCVSFYTGLSLLDAQSGATQQHLDITRVHFRQLSLDEIRHYLARERPLDCAGSFKSEALGIALFERIDSEDPNALIGLPLLALCRLLRQWDSNPLLFGA